MKTSISHQQSLSQNFNQLNLVIFDHSIIFGLKNYRTGFPFHSIGTKKINRDLNHVDTKLEDDISFRLIILG